MVREGPASPCSSISCASSPQAGMDSPALECGGRGGQARAACFRPQVPFDELVDRWSCRRDVVDDFKVGEDDDGFLVRIVRVRDEG